MRDFPGGSAVKNLPASAGDARDLGPIPGSGRSPGERWQPTPVLLPGKPYGRRSLAGCSPWGHKSVRHDLVTNRGRNRPTLSSDTTRKSGNAWPRSGGRGSEDTLSANVVLCVCVCVCVLGVGGRIPNHTVLQQPLHVHQFSSIRTVFTQNPHQIPQVRGSVPRSYSHALQTLTEVQVGACACDPQTENQRSLRPPSLVWFNWLEWLTELKKILFTRCLIYYVVTQVVSDSLRPHGLQHISLPRPSPAPRAWWLIIKGYRSGIARWKRCRKQDMWGGGTMIPAPSCVRQPRSSLNLIPLDFYGGFRKCTWLIPPLAIGNWTQSPESFPFQYMGGKLRGGAKSSNLLILVGVPSNQPPSLGAFQKSPY